ncbi:hypothetical protein [Microbacterium sp. ZW T5_56]|uniref:hypothetical protein n=1 Tax=Microbacterium sp. ZW T5_56 TaxID=3378081 RepID=UPI003854E361
MRVNVLLLAVAVATGTAIGPTPDSLSGPPTCDLVACYDYGPGDDGTQVDIGGIETPSEPQPATPDDGAESDPGVSDGGETSPDPVPAPPGPGDLCWDNLNPLACTTPTIPEPEPTPEQPAYPDTIYNTDLIHFAPHNPTATAPNEAMALTNTPLPITLTATTHTLTGTLLGHPVTVTFTPTGFTLDHGDNTTPTHATDNPATIAHTYTSRGTYPTTISTTYTATVTFPDNIPRPVQGTITITTPGPITRILAAHTAPVRTTCTTTPTAPAC